MTSCKFGHWGGLAAVLFGLAVCSASLHAQGRTGAGNPLDQLPATAPSPSPKPLNVEIQAPAGPAVGRLDQTLRPSRFDIEGVEAIPFDEVARLFSPLTLEPVTVRQLVAVAAEATALYRATGHPLSFVYVPAQSFDGGVVRVVAVEGYIASVRIEGNPGPAQAKLLEIAQRLVGERPLRMTTFERVSQLLTRVPGVTVTAEASLPGTTDGATVLLLKVRRQPYDFSISADLRQPTPRAVLTGTLNDPVVPGGQLSASTALGNFEQEKVFTLGYTQMVGSDGLALKSSLTSYRGYPDKQSGPGDPIERFSVNRRAEFSASYPLALTATGSLTVAAGLYAVDNVDTYHVPQNGVTLNDETRVRVLFSQLAWTESTATRSRSASVLLAHGLPFAGARAFQSSNTPGVAGNNLAELNFSRIAIDASQRDRYANAWGTAVSLGAQYSPDSLAASERISYGGVRFGRGYAAGDAAGDSGWGAAFELNRQFKVDGGAWLQQIEPYLLLEAAGVRTRFGDPSPKKLRSAALGARWTDARHYSLDLAVAKPMGDAALTNPERRIRVSLMLTYQLGNP